MQNFCVHFISRPKKKKKKVLKKSDRPKENKSTSAKLASIKHRKFYQVSLSNNKCDLWVFIFFSVIPLILVLSFFSTSELLLSFICTDLQVDPVGQQWQGMLIPFSYRKKAIKKICFPKASAHSDEKSRPTNIFC